MRHNLTLTTLLSLSTLSVSSMAQEASASAGVSLSDQTATASADTDDDNAPETDSYFNRYEPEGDLWEFGLFGGVMLPSTSHNLRAPDASQQPFDTALEVGARFAYYPLSFLGAELEGAGMTSKVDDGSSGGLFAGRAHLIGQLPLGSITPFLLFGGGALGGASSAMGTDIDPAIHFGAGVKAAIDEYLSLRVDLRDTVTQKFGAAQGVQTHHPELLFGLSFTLERKKPDPDGDGFANHRDNCPNVAGGVQGCPADQDLDGVPDDVDQCKEAAGPAPSGCPDRDGDGRIDKEDSCPDIAANTSTGCPEPVCGDRDGDQVTDDVDKCPTEQGPAPDGCPVRDRDGDGIADDVDQCPDEPETKNGYQDKDGCSDEVPEAVKRFSGVIPGIEFAYNSATIQPHSNALLDEAANVLKEYGDLTLEIAGHSDSQGPRELNLDLSRRRAESVKSYLTTRGVDAARLTTRGVGPDEPIADNETEAGRQKNRRIEFRRTNQ